MTPGLLKFVYILVRVTLLGLKRKHLGLESCLTTPVPTVKLEALKEFSKILKLILGKNHFNRTNRADLG